jgi:hypothetical protein
VTSYKLLGQVHGWEQSRGDFTIEVKGVDHPPNDKCEDAVTLELFDTVSGATYFAQQDGNHDFSTCGTSQGFGFSSPGVWYEIEGSGGLLEVSIRASYDTQLTVFTGECNALTCVSGTEGYTTDFFSGSVLWESVEATMYTILVHGFSGQVGEYELYIAEAQRPSNDVCEDAIALEINDVVAGSNEFAADDVVPICGKCPRPAKMEFLPCFALTSSRPYST